MSKTYISRPGDTFSSISRAETGSERNTQIIRQSNPHASVPIRPGTRLQIPGGDTSASFKPFGLDCKIGGVSVKAYDTFTYSSAIDGFSRMEYVIPNEKETRQIAPMLTPTPVDCGYNGQQMFAGYMTAPIPTHSE